MAVHLALSDIDWSCRSLAGEERLGVPSSFEVEVSGPAGLDTKSLLRAPATLTLETLYGERAIGGIVWRATQVVSFRAADQRTYRLTVVSRLGLGAKKRRCRVFRNKTVPEIVTSVLVDLGYAASDVKTELGESHSPRRYVVQYEETDLAFVRRLCEDEGLFFRFGADGSRETIVLADTSSSAPERSDPLSLVDRSDLRAPTATAYHWTSERRRRPGAVHVRDHDCEKPNVTLEGRAEEGAPIEREHGVFAAPFGVKDASQGTARSRLLLESLRASAQTGTFETTALDLAPGNLVRLSADPALPNPPQEQRQLIVAVRHAWRATEGEHRLHVSCVPGKVPYRLPRETPRPRIAGVQSAIVTGAPGEEIHPDALGRVHVRFHWDTEGPSDDKSSPPVRVLQQQVAGSMNLPRVGWEVLVAFEDGDPERPFVIGRSYNAKMPPPFALPKNKTVTSYASSSSPGGAGTNSIHFDDAAGSEHLKIQAAFGKSVTTGADMIVQTTKNERQSVTGNLTSTVGASEVVKVAEALFHTLGTDSVTVGAIDAITVGGSQNISVGSETVVVGGALIEQVGDPGKGVENLAANAVLQGLGSTGPKGAIAAAVLGIAKGAAEAGARDGWAAAGKAAGMGAAGVVAGLVPGGEALLSAVTGATQPNPWDHAKDGEGDRAAGGGAGGGASDGAGASGPGPGHRNVLVDGGGLEINGAFSVLTPGRIAWTTAGAALFLTGASKSITASSMTYRTLGVSAEGLGPSSITSAGPISRVSATTASMIAAGALSESAGADYVLKAPAVTVKIGSFTLSGSTVVFVTPGAQIGIGAAGVKIQASGPVTFDGAVSQSGTMVVP